MKKNNVIQSVTDTKGHKLNELYENEFEKQPIEDGYTDLQHKTSDDEGDDINSQSEFVNEIDIKKYLELINKPDRHDNTILDTKILTNYDTTDDEDNTSFYVKKYNTYEDLKNFDNYVVSWDQHLVPTSPFTSEFTSPNVSNTDVTDTDVNNSDDNESVILKPLKRVIKSDDLLGRRYFRNTSLSALSLLIAACHLIKRRMRDTREILVNRQRDFILELHKISIILG
uniref:Large tegument protein-like protein n=1 Tax=Walrus alphaherpesvirus 1 TaxID=2717850 RepID=A0A7G1GXQ0_9ALPH|nr:large tegument protein-like protein [Walrus alphaherpesvirus 1]